METSAPPTPAVSFLAGTMAEALGAETGRVALGSLAAVSSCLPQRELGGPGLCLLPTVGWGGQCLSRPWAQLPEEAALLLQAVLPDPELWYLSAWSPVHSSGDLAQNATALGSSHVLFHVLNQHEARPSACWSEHPLSF